MRLKKLRWTSHALEALAERDIEQVEVERTLASPELTIVDPSRPAVLMRQYVDGGWKRPMLLRLVVKETPDERAVIPASKSSLFAKYLSSTMP